MRNISTPLYKHIVPIVVDLPNGVETDTTTMGGSTCILMTPFVLSVELLPLNVFRRE